MIVLIILDGWGYDAHKKYNAIAQANLPQWNKWWETAPKALLDCSGEAAGLPHGQMGNSEVGHMHIGAGRILEQDYTRINHAIEEGYFFRKEVLLSVIDNAHKKAIHVLGLLSPGGVHSHENHIHALLKAVYQKNPHQTVYLHLFLDGRDTPPCSAKPSIEKLAALLKQYPNAEIKSITGRYYAMDRDSRWDRIEKAYDLLTTGQAQFHALTALEALEKAYERKENDEFVQPTLIGKPGFIEDGDTVIFMNYRADRARQLSHALISPDFTGFERKKRPQIGQFVTLTHYAKDIPSIELFPPLRPQHTLGECIAKAGLTQLRVAETEKYAHVTFFFNGGVEKPFPHEDRVLVPSPKVATYDLQPEMSAIAVKNYIIEALEDRRYDVIIANFANADMVGHTGDMNATIQAVECLDRCLSEIAEVARKVSAEILITADHGNAECMYDPDTHQQHTSHTVYPVPFLYLGNSERSMARQQGSLIDIAPTMLYLLGLPIPSDMQGKSLLK
jgi:2,3-bisphosphoglycerate-independent phosphoglycerate mutase